MVHVFRFTAIVVILIAAVLASLAVVGVLTSSELWNNLAKVAQLAGVVLVACAAVLAVSHKK